MKRILLSLVFVFGCNRVHKQDSALGDGTVFLDQEFASVCDGFEAMAHLALELHISQKESDYAKLLASAFDQLSENLKEEPLLENSSNLNCTTLDEVYQKLDSQKISEIKFYSILLQHFIETLDPHSTYISKDEVQEFEDQQSNVGLSVGFILERPWYEPWVGFKKLKIKAVVSETLKATLKPGDEITGVNGQSTAGKEYGDWVRLIYQTPSEITLELNGSKTISISKRKAHVPALIHETIEYKGKKIGWIEVRNFLEGASKEFIAAINHQEANHADVYVVDLRNNGGGFLHEATAMIDALVDEGFVTQTEYSKKHTQLSKKNQRYAAKASGQLTDKPMVILTSPVSASASELFVGALSPERVVHVGARTYGKGVGQQVFKISSKTGLGGFLFLTVFKYVMFDGLSPQGLGFKPHIEFTEPLLAQIEQKQISLKRPIREENEPNAVQPFNPPRAPLMSPTLKNVLTNLQTNDFECTQTDDCWKEQALFVAAEVAKQTEKWPLITLKDMNENDSHAEKRFARIKR